MKNSSIDVRAVLEGAWKSVDLIDRALAAGEIDEAEWYRRNQALIVPAYLAADNPRAQSGHSGDAARWVEARGDLACGIDRAGTFLDVGCANGHLMETAVAWAAARGFALEPYGLDLSPELVELARRRLPDWQDRLFVGNALDWVAADGRRFDFVHVMQLDYVPPPRRAALVEHLLTRVCASGGRLILGPTNERREEAAAEAQVAGLGWPIAGRAERPHADPRVMRRVFWVDAPRTVLFLCTGNYFRSRYAECAFNARAAAAGLPVRALSRGLAIESGSKNVGPMARQASERLTRRGIGGPALERMPVPVTVGELEGATRIIALKAAEHRPLVSARYPEFGARIEYWHVHDVDCCPAEQALDLIDRLVDDLVDRW